MKFLRVAASVFVLLLLAGFALAFSVYQSYSDLAELNQKAKTKFADWEVALAPRRGMLAELSEIVSAYDSSADALQTAADRVLEDAPEGNDVSARIAMHMIYGSTLNQMRGLAMRYPQLRDSEVYREWEADFLKSQVSEEAAKSGYNSAVRDYNEVLDSFTGKLIAIFFNVPPKLLIPS